MRPASRHAPSTPLHNQLLSQNGTMPAASMAMHIPPTPAKRGWGFVFVFVFCSSFVLIGGLCKEKKTRIAEKKLYTDLEKADLLDVAANSGMLPLRFNMQ
ncbi:hypothetical protein DKX38_027575 [Salix brachista]|uniref:Uncharacterized protein n=1 Tax=Salix brachista TaxID=2182728 RepID=A0A5N5J3C0_9ROSI|nr:hypothetical protein DKX38_027575 [Salix brachista]